MDVVTANFFFPQMFDSIVLLDCPGELTFLLKPQNANHNLELTSLFGLAVVLSSVNTIGNKMRVQFQPCFRGIAPDGNGKALGAELKGGSLEMAGDHAP